MKEKNLPLWTGINGAGMVVWWVAFASLWTGRFGESLMALYGRVETYVTPTELTFMVWPLVIITMAISFVVIHQKGQAKFAGSLGVPYLTGQGFAVGWAYATGTGRLGWAAVFISFSVLFFSIAYHRLYESQAPLRMTFGLSIALAWFSASTVLAWAVYLREAAWDPFIFEPMQYALIVITAALFISSVLIFQKRDWVFSLVVVWGMEGISEVTTDLGYRILIVMSMTLLIAFILTLFTWRARGHSRTSDSYLN
ncbi:hypothetical protein SANA_06240 [Gottschalkiaceae bacterium SANA]|nr:hypothetical protein SANA_06240 [Gottschalkiaceae bacterium SANA]